MWQAKGTLFALFVYFYKWDYGSYLWKVAVVIFYPIITKDYNIVFLNGYSL